MNTDRDINGLHALLHSIRAWDSTGEERQQVYQNFIAMIDTLSSTKRKMGDDTDVALDTVTYAYYLWVLDAAFKEAETSGDLRQYHALLDIQSRIGHFPIACGTELHRPVAEVLDLLEKRSPDAEEVVAARKRCISNHVRFTDEKDPDVAPLTVAATAVLNCVLVRRFKEDLYEVWPSRAEDLTEEQEAWLDGAEWNATHFVVVAPPDGAGPVVTTGRYESASRGCKQWAVRRKDESAWTNRTAANRQDAVELHRAELEGTQALDSLGWLDPTYPKTAAAAAQVIVDSLKSATAVATPSDSETSSGPESSSCADDVGSDYKPQGDHFQLDDFLAHGFPEQLQLRLGDAVVGMNWSDARTFALWILGCQVKQPLPEEPRDRDVVQMETRLIQSVLDKMMREIGADPQEYIREVKEVQNLPKTITMSRARRQWMHRKDVVSQGGPTFEGGPYPEEGTEWDGRTVVADPKWNWAGEWSEHVAYATGDVVSCRDEEENNILMKMAADGAFYQLQGKCPTCGKLSKIPLAFHTNGTRTEWLCPDSKCGQDEYAASLHDLATANSPRHPTL